MKQELSQQDKEYLEELAGKKILDVNAILKTFDIHNRLIGAITLLNAEQVGKAFNVIPETIHKWVRQGIFPPPDIKFEKRFSRWKYHTLIEWIDKQYLITVEQATKQHLEEQELKQHKHKK